MVKLSGNFLVTRLVTAMSIDKLPSGKWRARIHRRGVRKTKTFALKVDAQEWIRSVEADDVAITLGKAARGKTLGDLLKRYADDVSPTKRGERWERLRINLILREFPELCKTSLSDLRASHFSEWRDARLKDVSPASVCREWNLLSASISIAVKEWGWLPVNPMSTVKRPKAGRERDRRPTADEIERLIYCCGYERDAAPVTEQARVGAAFLFEIETAMRAGEIVNLKWSDVDITRRVANLRSAPRERPRTKNGDDRVVPLSLEALRLIEQCRGIDATRVFAIGGDQLDVLFRRARDRALIDDLHFHDGRREALTRLAAKVDVMTLAKISGHRDLRILLRVYYAPNMESVAKNIET